MNNLKENMRKDFVNIIIGDSISYGIGDNKYFGWANRIKSKDSNTLKEFYFNLSIPGQSSCEIVKRFELELKNRFNKNDNYRLIYAFGIKDALLLNNNCNHIKIFEKNILKIIKVSKKYTNSIYFLGLLDVDFEKRKEYNIENIIKIDKLLEKTCEINKVFYINMNNIVSLDELIDGLHPNSNGHKKVSDYLYNEIYTKL
jgi:hypothetical protein